MPSAPSDYRLAPLLAARLVGALLVCLALVLLLATVLVAVLDLSPDLLVVGAGLGVVVVLLVGYLLTRRTTVVHLDEQGFRVRLVRGAGVSQGTWQEVQEVVTATPDGLPVLVLRLRGGRTTTIPVTILATDRETFVRDLVSRAQGGQGLRPLS